MDMRHLMMTHEAIAFFVSRTKEISSDDTPFDESGPLFGSEKIGRGSKLY
jgi:hypothetical protein